MDFQIVRYIVGIVAFMLIFWLQQKYPIFPRKEKLLNHSARNMLFAIVNTVLTVLIFLQVYSYFSSSYLFTNFGLLRWLNFSTLVESIIALLLFDLWMYLWHRINHESKFLWKFHRMHHTDRELDVTSALRFHPIEIILSSSLRLFIFVVLGMEFWHMLLYESILLPVIFLHHSNLSVRKFFDKMYRVIFASPMMHWVHHSDLQNEADSNYGSVFSFWDRAFKTFRIRNDPENIVMGVDDFKTDDNLTLWGMIRTPFKSKMRDV